MGLTRIGQKSFFIFKPSRMSRQLENNFRSIQRRSAHRWQLVRRRFGKEFPGHCGEIDVFSLSVTVEVLERFRKATWLVCFEIRKWRNVSLLRRAEDVASFVLHSGVSCLESKPRVVDGKMPKTLMPTFDWHVRSEGHQGHNRRPMSVRISVKSAYFLCTGQNTRIESNFCISTKIITLFF